MFSWWKCRPHIKNMPVLHLSYFCLNSKPQSSRCSVDSLSSSYLLIGHLFSKGGQMKLFFSLFEHLRLTKGSRFVTRPGFWHKFHNSIRFSFTSLRFNSMTDSIQYRLFWIYIRYITCQISQGEKKNSTNAVKYRPIESVGTTLL